MLSDSRFPIKGRRINMKDHEEKKSKKTRRTEFEDGSDTRVPTGFDDINSADAESQDNVISDTKSEILNRKHGRDHGEPLTGSTPKTDS